MSQKGELSTIDTEDLDFLNEVEEQSEDSIIESPFKSRPSDISKSGS